MQKHSIYKAFKPLFLLFSIALLTSGSIMASEGSDGDHAESTDSHVVNEEAVSHDSHGGHEAFNAGEMIMHHVMDSYDIHLMDIGGHAISIPLPIVLFSVDGGMSVFMSSKFEHGHTEYQGYILKDGHIYKRATAQSEVLAEQGFVAANWGGYFAGETDSFIDLSITKTVAGILITVLLMFLVFGSVAKAYKRGADKAPKGFQALMETLILFIRDEIAKPSIGSKYERFMPFLLTIFFFIWFANILGLIPFIGGFNVTGNIAVTLVLALFTFVVTTVNGNKTYWGHIFATPGVP
ncbi:MAG: F0F1 ATP synthase subunit A, partial [Flavobacteriales bacterium]